MNAKPLLFASAVLTGCIDLETTGTETSELAIGFSIDTAHGAWILGSSADRRWVAYGTECDAGDERTTIKLYDTWTTLVTTLAHGSRCAPGAVVFSPDGWLAAFGDGFGHLGVHDSLWNRTVSVSRDGAPTIGVMFSPDSQWFVVASAEDAPLGATLDAWDADLVTHVEIAQHAVYSPFALGPTNVTFSPDSDRLLFLGDLSSPPPIGALKIWNHDTRATRTLATAVAAGGWAVRADWRYVAYVRDVVAGPPSPLPLDGDLVVQDLTTNQTRTVETDATSLPLGFAGDRLLYGMYASANPPSSAITLKMHDIAHATTATLDTNVFAGFGANAISVTPDGARVAYTRNFDPMHFQADLRVATLAPLGSPKTISTAAVPVTSYGWLDGGRILGFLHHPSSTFPGATMGTLSAWNAQTNSTVQLATQVTQIGLAFDPAAPDLLFTSAYDMALAAGDLRAWNARTGATRLLDHRAAVMQVQRSGDGASAGYLQVHPAQDPQQPPATKLRVSRISGPQRTATVDNDVTTLAMGWLGRVVYTTAEGVFDAVAY